MAAYGLELADSTSGCYQRVFIKKKQGASLGLVLKGGVDCRKPITIDHIRPGSIAERSECLMCGDIVAAINDIVTSQLSRSELAVMLRNAGPRLCLDLVFDSSLGIVHNDARYTSKILCVTLRRPSDVSFGLVLRTVHTDVIVMHIRSGSAVDCDGRLRIGDRLIKVSTNEMAGEQQQPEAATAIDPGKDNRMTQEEILNVLRTEECAIIEFEYQISIQDEVSKSQGGLLVEIDKITQSARLGITFTKCQTQIIIDTIDIASIAERCGALHPGDCILSINGSKPTTSTDAARLATTTAPSSGQGHQGHVIRLEILPLRHRYATQLVDCSVSLTFDPSHGGLGFTCSIATEEEEGEGALQTSLQICHIFADSPAERCGLIYKGDTLLSIDNVKVNDLEHYEAIINELSEGQTLNVIIQFTVDKPQTSIGEEIDVCIPDKTVTLGITISNLETDDQSIIISDIKPGSISHRCGLICEEDRLLSVDNEAVSCNDLRAAALMLQASDVKTISIRKASDKSPKHYENDLDSIEYTVTLPRKKHQSLGITISGTENCDDVIVISAMAEQGLAARTGAVQIGDRLMEINGTPLDHLALSNALKLLSDAGNMVTMKISRKLTETTKSRAGVKAQDVSYLLSIDSALESWDSSGHESHQEVMSQPLATSSPWQLQPKPTNRRSTLSTLKPHFNLQDDHDLPPPPKDWNSSGTSISTNEDEWSTRHYQQKDQSASDSDSHGDHFRQHIRVLLERDNKENKGFGFGVSDGCNAPTVPTATTPTTRISSTSSSATTKGACSDDTARGVYVSALRMNGPADKAGLRRYDQILKVNSVIVKNLDVAAVVALISGSKLEMCLVVARNLTCSLPRKSMHPQFF